MSLLLYFDYDEALVVGSDIIDVVWTLLTVCDLLLESSDFVSVSTLAKSVCLFHCVYCSLRSCDLALKLLDIFL